MQLKDLNSWINQVDFSKRLGKEIVLEGYLNSSIILKYDLNTFKNFSVGDEYIYSALIDESYKGKIRLKHWSIGWINFTICKKLLDNYLQFLIKKGFKYYYDDSIIFVGNSLKNLLKKDIEYRDYEGKIRIYGFFRGVDSTTKINVGKIWKVDILGKYGEVKKSII